MGHIEKNKFGLVGKNISYSFSRGYFDKKFKELGLKDHIYENFDLVKIEEFRQLIKVNPNLKGLNVTIPYKEAVIPYLDQISKKAKKIGAVNTIKFSKAGLKGYNTDIYGFKKSIRPFLKKRHKKALILGTGGASKAVAFVFEELGIEYTYVSRTPSEHEINYESINKSILEEYLILVNCTPIGTFPDVGAKPNIPYQYLSKKHLLFDLIYNPDKTAFLMEGETQGASICNGLKMLELQAEKAWRIWNS